jgi:predicted CXXCH cytochrome family protein
MSSRKKIRKTAPPETSARSKGARTRLLVIGVGLIVGSFVGVFAGFIYFATHHSPVNVGTFTAIQGPTTVSDKELYATYAGAESCRQCHTKEYEAWSNSHHGQAERKIDPALDKPAFDPPRLFEHGTQKTEVRTKGEQFEIVALGYDAKPTPYVVARVIGVDPLRQFLTRTTQGRMQTFEASYDPHKNQWFDVYGSEDRKPGEWGHWTGRGMNWNSQCAACHNTRVRKNYDEAADSYQTAMAQMTVSCESCHGPMKQHVTQKKSGMAASATSSPTTRPYHFTKDQITDTCATCHARRAELTGEFSPGEKFFDHYSLSIPDLSETFYPDGQVKEEDYEYTAFSGSKMHAAGVRCGDCHDPHSSKTLFEGNNLCMRCHNGSFKGSPVIVPEQHSFHKADSPGNQCVNCHMPQTTYMQRHARHDHGFTIPDPLLTKEQNIPNACNRCHADQNADWSLAAVDKWYGPKMQRPTRERARAIAKARRGDDAVRETMLKMLKEEKQPFWQAVAASILIQWSGTPEVRDALIAATAHADLLVRENAARALEPVAQQNDIATRGALAKLLADPIRAVRVRAAWALRNSIDGRSKAGEDLQTYLQQAADQPTGAMQQGLYHLARREITAAISYFRKAIDWDPNSAPFHDSLAFALNLEGNNKEAIEQLKKAMQLDPREADYAYRLALVYSEEGQYENAITLLNQALNLNPRHARAAYNLGLAYSKINQPTEAITALKRAEQIDPADPQIPYARATLHAQLNQKNQAIEACKRALALDPNYFEAARLLQQLIR